MGGESPASLRWEHGVLGTRLGTLVLQETREVATSSTLSPGPRATWTPVMPIPFPSL